MGLTSIQIQNFLSVAAPVVIQLDIPGVTCIYGENKDAPNANSNGSGKSLILEAICWCLWGTTIRGYKSDDVINTQVGQDCRVALSLEKDGKKYDIVRVRKWMMSDFYKTNDLKIYLRQDGVPTEITAGTASMAQVQINKLVGMDFKIFCAMMPGAGVKLAEMTDLAIKRLIEDILEFYEIENALTATKDKIKKQTHFLQEIKHECELVHTKLAQNDSMVKYQQQTLDFLTKSHKDQMNWIDTKIQDIEKSLLKVQADYKDLKAQIEDTTDMQLYKKLESEVQAWSQQIKDKTAAYNGEKANLTSSFEFYGHQIKALKKQMESMKKQAVCPTCGQAMTLEHLAEENTKLSTEIKDYLSIQKKLVENLNSMKAKHAEFTLQCEYKVTDLKKQLEELAPKVHSKQGLMATLQEYKKQWVLLEKDRDNWLKTKTDKGKEYLDAIKSAKDAIKSLESEAYSLMKEAEELQESVQDREKDLKILTYWEKAFKPTGIRNSVLQHIIPFLNERVNYYADILTEGEMEIYFKNKVKLKNGNVKDQFDIVVKQKHGAPTYAGSSKGEQARADICIALAIGDLAASRTTSQLKIRFLDEAFDGMDESGMNAIIALLQEQQEKYKTIFLISHNPMFQANFTQKLKVVKQNGVTTVEEHPNV